MIDKIDRLYGLGATEEDIESIKKPSTETEEGLKRKEQYEVYFSKATQHNASSR